MGINEDEQSVISTFVQDSDYIVDVLVVVFSTIVSDSLSGWWIVRPGVFNGFPGDQKPDDIESVSFYASEMLICVLKRERSSYEADIVSVQKSVSDMGRDIGNSWLFRVSADIQSPQCKNAAAELASRNASGKERYRPLLSLK